MNQTAKELTGGLIAAAIVCLLAFSCTAPTATAEPVGQKEETAASAETASASGIPSARCVQREATGETPCSEAEYQAEAAAWNEYYGCDPRGCGFIDFDENPEIIGGALVLEPVPEDRKANHEP